MKRFPNGVDGDFFHQKRVPRRIRTTSASSSSRSRAGTRPSSRSIDNAAALAWVDQPRLHRAAHVALARRRHRAARLPADRPRPDDATGSGRTCARSRSSCSEVMDELGLASLPEDVRRDRAAHPRADQAGAAVPGGAALREGARGGGRAARRRPGRRDDDVARRRSARRLRRLRPERARPDDRRPRTRCGRPRTRGSRRRCAGTRSRTSTRRRSRVETMRSADRGGRRPDARACGGARRACAPRFEQLGLEPAEPISCRPCSSRR